MRIAEKFSTYRYWSLEDVDIPTFFYIYLLINLVAHKYLQDWLIKNILKVKFNKYYYYKILWTLK